MTMHIGDTELHDYLDDLVAADERAGFDAHLGTCAACASRLRSLEGIQAALRSLPHSIEPATDLLPGIRTRLGMGAAPVRHAGDAQVLELPAMPQAPYVADGTSAQVRRRMHWPVLAAAAVALCILSSLVTLAIVRGTRDTQTATATSSPLAEAQLVQLRATEARYQGAIEELRSALLQEQGVLEPETVRLLEQSLTTIDRALAEARAALAADPANALLAEMLRANYEKKLELLRHASAHARVRL